MTKLCCDLPSSLKKIVMESGNPTIIEEYRDLRRSCMDDVIDETDERIYSSCMRKVSEVIPEDAQEIAAIDMGRLTSDYQVAALYANLVNRLAKTVSEEFYDCKPAFVRLAAHLSPEGKSGEKDGVVYIDTDVGQVSFHMFDELYDKIDKEDVANILVDWDYPKEWSGEPAQEIAIDLLLKYLGESV